MNPRGEAVQRFCAGFQQPMATPGAARAFGRVAASLRRSGRKSTARSYDAMIAAIAVANDLPVYTCNPADFTGIDDLHVIEVPVSESQEPSASV